MYFSFIQLTSHFTLSTTRRTNKQLNLELLPMFFFRSAVPCTQHLFPRDTSWLLNKFWKSESIHELRFLMCQGPMPQSAPSSSSRKTCTLSLNWHTSLQLGLHMAKLLSALSSSRGGCQCHKGYQDTKLRALGREWMN